LNEKKNSISQSSPSDNRKLAFEASDLHPPDHIHPNDYLSSKSVVLITGAAGHLGSELAMALYRTFSPKKIILIDSLEDFSSSEDDPKQNFEKMEYKRQRIFNVIQTLGNVARFYKCDLRPVIPEFLEVGEIPAFNMIIQQNPDITHIVHLASIRDTEKAIPRGTEDIRAGMMETILEQFKKLQDQKMSSAEKTSTHERNGVDNLLPHFVYASSYEVYNKENGPLTEDDIIEGPMSLFGTSKLLDEILAHTYYNMYDIFSVGLRFFEVYGQWGRANSNVSILAENIIEELAREGHLSSANIFDGVSDIHTKIDYVYIDDAVDAIMAAMQFRPQTTTDNEKTTPPVLFNVASGESYSVQEIATKMAESIQHEIIMENENSPTGSALSLHASVAKTQSNLGFKSQIDLDEGVRKLLAWHYDRSHLYRKNVDSQQTSLQEISSSYGLLGCNPFDDECLKGAAAYTCSSECAHSQNCIPSIYDHTIALTKSITNDCNAVLYTIALGEAISSIPSATINSAPNSIPNVVSPNQDAHCNIAFVSENGILYQKLLLQTSNSQQNKKIVKHGFWTLIPIIEVDLDVEQKADRYLPKYSPGNFFSNSVQYAIYADPNIHFYNIPRLLQEVYDPQIIFMTPSSKHSLGSIENPNDRYEEMEEHIQTILQQKTYNMIGVGMNDNLREGNLNSRWIVHRLEEDSSDYARFFRCDILSELISWGVFGYDTALNFISSMHDYWATQSLDKDTPTSLQNEKDAFVSRNLQHYSDEDPMKGYEGAIDAVEQSIGKSKPQRRLEASENYHLMNVVASSTSSRFVKVLQSDANYVVYLDE